VLTDGCDGLAGIDRAIFCDEFEGALGAGLSSLIDGLGPGDDCRLGLGVNTLSRTVARSRIKSRPAPGAGWALMDRPGELTAGGFTAGGVLRTTGDDGLLSTRGLGEDGNERD